VVFRTLQHHRGGQSEAGSKHGKPLNLIQWHRLADVLQWFYPQTLTDEFFRVIGPKYEAKLEDPSRVRLSDRIICAVPFSEDFHSAAQPQYSFF